MSPPHRPLRQGTADFLWLAPRAARRAAEGGGTAGFLGSFSLSLFWVDFPGVKKAVKKLKRIWANEEVHLSECCHGHELGLAFAAFKGDLTGAVLMRKTLTTDKGKTWGGHVQRREQ